MPSPVRVNVAVVPAFGARVRNSSIRLAGPMRTCAPGAEGIPLTSCPDAHIVEGAPGPSGRAGEWVRERPRPSSTAPSHTRTLRYPESPTELGVAAEVAEERRRRGRRRSAPRSSVMIGEGAVDQPEGHRPPVWVTVPSPALSGSGVPVGIGLRVDVGEHDDRCLRKPRVARAPAGANRHPSPPPSSRPSARPLENDEVAALGVAGGGRPQGGGEQAVDDLRVDRPRVEVTRHCRPTDDLVELHERARYRGPSGRPAAARRSRHERSSATKGMLTSLLAFSSSEGAASADGCRRGRTGDRAHVQGDAGRRQGGGP